jgi:hypothetical protein
MKALRLPTRVSAVAYWFASTAHGYLLGSCPPQRSRKGGGPLPGRGSWSAGARSVRLAVRGREWDLSGLQAIRPVPLLRSGTPVEPTCPCHTGHVDAAPAGWTAKASAKSDFGANTQLRHPLPYASRGRCRTRARLASGRLAGLCREGVEPPGSLREVSARIDGHSPLLLS